jgi:uncharacterized protein (DUF1697 family)
MQKLISLLRGVNMTGHNKIKMTDLAALFKKAGFENAITYIQSGNVIFNNTGGFQIPDISSIMENAILRKFKYEIPVLIRTAEEIKKIISINPFFAEKDFDPAKLAVIFLYEKPAKAQIEKVRNVDYPPDKFKIIGKEIFIYCPNGFGKTKLYTNFFENKMKVVGTARNWKTVNSILEIAENK